MITSVWSRLSRFSKEFRETRQDQDFRNKDLKMGKKKDIPNQDLGNQEGNENIKCTRSKNENILLYSAISHICFVTLMDLYHVIKTLCTFKPYILANVQNRKSKRSCQHISV